MSIELLICLKRLGRAGKPEAYYALACLFDNPGEGYSGYEEVTEYYPLAYYNGYHDAACGMAYFCYRNDCSEWEKLLWYCRAFKYANGNLYSIIKEYLTNISSYKHVLDEWISEAKNGNMYFMNDLAEFLLCVSMVFTYTESNMDKALKLLTKSTEGDCIFAQMNLAECYENGIGLNYDLEKALYWYKKAALQEGAEYYYAKRKYKELKGKIMSISTIK